MNPDLFQLLPAVYRLRDAQIAGSETLLSATELAELNALQALTAPLTADQQALFDELTAKASRGPLQSFLMVIAEQIAAMAEDLDQLYDDQFIETCAVWVIPYIGDLIGYQSVKGVAPAVDNPRSEVAETISLRRRKGTVLVMEQLARDVTGWGAHAVELFRVLADTQYMKHIRRENFYAPDLRHWQSSLYLDTGFDRTAHKVDVHLIASRRGRYNIQNIGIFLWSLGAYSVTDAPATAVLSMTPGAPPCFRFNPLGMDAPLFHRAVSQGEQIADAAGPVNVPDRLLRRVLCEDLQKGVGAAYYGAGKSLALVKNGQLLNPYQIRVADLSDTSGSWANLPSASDTQYAALIDPELGRIVLPSLPGDPQPPQLTVSYYRGFNADMGGGEYARSADFTVTDPAWIFPYPDTASPKRYLNLQAALNFAVKELGENGQVAIEFAGSGAQPAGGPLTVDLPAGTTLELRAADGSAPTLLLDGEFVVSGDAASTLILDGLMLAASSAMSPGSPSPTALVHVPALRPDGTANLLGTLSLLDCTLVPGWSVGPDGEPVSGNAPALIGEAAGVVINAERSIVGAIRAAPLVTVSLCDSVIDATDKTRVAYAAPDGEAGGGALTLEGCTVFGKVHAVLLTLVSNSIIFAALAAGDTWASGLIADRKQEGCVRFSFLPVHAITPRRFKCVEAALAAPQPLFFSLRYGHPAYMKLLVSTDDTIRRGASDGGEMGAFHFLLAPQREGDLRIRLQEYLPVGLESGLIYQT
ncbi:YmfQ family protein [Paraburkholderia sp. HD33-4]|uniref:YmfQ family protein n=1 Tax=Paraburkholderia sp. HD33-4 TaxID=2883242 RepID=UPI001F23493E|nr:YmfQ family protein [Paraburkholderia sp. HD33-4]